MQSVHGPSPDAGRLPQQPAHIGFRVSLHLLPVTRETFPDIWRGLYLEFFRICVCSFVRLVNLAGILYRLCAVYVYWRFFYRLCLCARVCVCALLRAL